MDIIRIFAPQSPQIHIISQLRAAFCQCVGPFTSFIAIISTLVHVIFLCLVLVLNLVLEVEQTFSAEVYGTYAIVVGIADVDYLTKDRTVIELQRGGVSGNRVAVA